MPGECTPQLREKIENTIRFLAVDAVDAANSGHPGAPMGLAAAAFELFDNHLRFDPGDPDWPLRDRFVLSAGHASMLLYALLHLYGYELSLDEIRAFRQWGALTPGHPEFGLTPGVETTTGPLGQGFAHAVGMALAARMTHSQFGGTSSADGSGPGEHFVYGIMGDGDMMEGVTSEAASLAGHLGLGNLIFIYDDNRVTIDGATELSFSEDVSARFEAQGWHVQGAIDGQAVVELADALEEARRGGDRPSLIVLRTVIGRGSPGVAGKNKAHGAALGPEETARTKQARGRAARSRRPIKPGARRIRDAPRPGTRRATESCRRTWASGSPKVSRGWMTRRENTRPRSWHGCTRPCPTWWADRRILRGRRRRRF